MIWLTSTNYFAVQLTHALGSIIIWRVPLDLNDLQAKYSIKQNDEINSSKPVSEKAIMILGGGEEVVLLNTLNIKTKILGLDLQKD